MHGNLLFFGFRISAWWPSARTSVFGDSVFGFPPGLRLHLRFLWEQEAREWIVRKGFQASDHALGIQFGAGTGRVGMLVGKQDVDLVRSQSVIADGDNFVKIDKRHFLRCGYLL